MRTKFRLMCNSSFLCFCKRVVVFSYLSNSSKVKKEHPKLHFYFSYAAILLANVELLFFGNHILHEFLLAKLTNIGT